MSEIKNDACRASGVEKRKESECPSSANNTLDFQIVIYDFCHMKGLIICVKSLPAVVAQWLWGFAVIGAAPVGPPVQLGQGSPA